MQGRYCKVVLELNIGRVDMLQKKKGSVYNDLCIYPQYPTIITVISLPLNENLLFPELLWTSIHLPTSTLQQMQPLRPTVTRTLSSSAFSTTSPVFMLPTSPYFPHPVLNFPIRLVASAAFQRTVTAQG